MALLFANNASSTLAGPITNTSTTVNVAAGSGVLFPQPGSGQYFKMTFLDAATKSVREIVHVTAVSGDAFTIARAQEGTTALNWLAGDFCSNQLTAGTLGLFAQAGSLPATYYAGADTGVVANALTVATTTPTAPTTLAGGQMYLLTKNAQPNTDAVTAKIGASNFFNVVYGNGSNLNAGDFPASATAWCYFTGGVFQLLGIATAPAVTTPVPTPKTTIFVASGTYTPTAGARLAVITATGGGGGGGGSDNGGGGGGGGAGATAIRYLALSGVSAQTVTVGAGGTGGNASLTGGVADNGGPGGATSVGSLAVAGGGLSTTDPGGGYHAQIGGNGGTATAGDLLVPGGSGASVTIAMQVAGGQGGSSIWGGGGAGSFIPRDGYTVDPGGQPGRAPGSGGGGGSAGGGYQAPGGAGAAGIVAITEYF